MHYIKRIIITFFLDYNHLLMLFDRETGRGKKAKEMRGSVLISPLNNRYDIIDISATYTARGVRI